jgi:hypothetical protein
MNNKFNLSLKNLALMGVLGFAGQAVSAPIQTDFGFAQSAGFAAIQGFNNVTGKDTFFNLGSTSQFIFGDSNTGMLNTLGGGASPSGTFNTMAWKGIANGTNAPSSLAITAYDNTTSKSAGLEVGGTGDGDSMWEAGEQWVISKLTQTNNTLYVTNGTIAQAINPLWVTDIVANLSIFSDSTRNTLVTTDPGTTRVEFLETWNPAYPRCDSFNPWGTACDDVYTLKTADAFDPTVFSYNGNQYQLSFNLIPGAFGRPGSNAIVCPSLDIRCNGYTDDELRIFTPEIKPGTSEVFITMSWKAIPSEVPEPASMALTGLGLLGLAAMRRRNRKV